MSKSSVMWWPRRYRLGLHLQETNYCRQQVWVYLLFTPLQGCSQCYCLCFVSTQPSDHWRPALAADLLQGAATWVQWRAEASTSEPSPSTATFSQPCQHCCYPSCCACVGWIIHCYPIYAGLPLQSWFSSHKELDQSFGGIHTMPVVTEHFHFLSLQLSPLETSRFAQIWPNVSAAVKFLLCSRMSKWAVH